MTVPYQQKKNPKYYVEYIQTYVKCNKKQSYGLYWPTDFFWQVPGTSAFGINYNLIPVYTPANKEVDRQAEKRVIILVFLYNNTLFAICFTIKVHLNVLT